MTLYASISRFGSGVLPAVALVGILLMIPWGNCMASTTPDDPVAVLIGLKINQITKINQKEENFSVVGTLRMNWSMESLAFEPAPGENDYRTYEVDKFIGILSEKNIRWPEISFYNQQGRSQIQNKIIHLDKDGTVQYLERFTATFQAPDFDFTRFPFDEQQFKVKIDSVFPEEEFVFRELPDTSGMADKLGEEEWLVTAVGVSISSQSESSNWPGSRFTLEFTAHRHLSFYVMRILIPSLLIVFVSWFSFFLRDYAKRVDLATRNLLLFIAFNFTISNDLPRLGYLTIMDAYLAGMFIITSLVVLENVLLKRLQDNGQEQLVQRLDSYALWLYPLSYAVVLAGITFALK